MVSPEFIDGLNANKYGFPYNAPGFEFPVIFFEFYNYDQQKLLEKIEYWLKEQIRRTFEPKKYMFSRNTTDILTLTSRIYELTRLPEELLEKITV